MASSSAPNPTVQTKEEKDRSWYLPLYKTAIKGDWKTASEFLDVDPNAVTAKITRTGETALHVAAGTRKATHFLENLLDLIPPASLETLVDLAGKTVLHSAALFGNLEAARILVARNPRLANTWSRTSLTPLQLAAIYGHRELSAYLFTVTKEDIEPNPFAGQPGVSLLNTLILSEFYDMALQLVERNPKLGTLESPANGTPLGAIAGKSSAFPSGTHYKLWQRLIYSRVPVKSENTSTKPTAGDSENPTGCSLVCAKTGSWVRFVQGTHFTHVCQKTHHMIWSVMERLVPQIGRIKETKRMHAQTLQLVKCLCVEVAALDDSTATSRFTLPVHSAAKLGIHEVVEEILDAFPAASWSLDRDDHDIFHQAVINRREKVFNLLYQLSEHGRLVTWLKDNKSNTILHLA